ncbi:MAG: alpha/beta fold hydrolase [Gemmatimonadaceae bacterium]
MTRFVRVATLLAFVLAAVTDRAAAQTQAGTVRPPGATLPYEIRGSGPPVVFVHGYTQNMSIWDDQMPAFAPRYRVIRYDVRGFGKSAGDVDPTTNAFDLATLLDSLRIPRATIIGLSMGAAIALNFAVNYPTRVNALVLYGAGPTDDFPVPGPPALFALFQELPRVVKAHGLDSMRKVLFASEIAWNPPNRPDVDRKLMKAWEGYTARELLDPKPPSGRVPPTRLAQVNAVRVPTLLVHGDHELAWFRQFNDTLQARLPNARRAVIENGGHGAHFAHPDRFNRAVLDFLQNLPR